MSAIEKRVEELHGYTSANLPAQVFSATEPLLLKGLVADWPMVQAVQESAQAGFDYLQKFCTEGPVNVSLGSPDVQQRIFYNESFTGFNFDFKRVQFQELVATLQRQQQAESGPMIYMGSTPIDYCLPGFRDHNDLALGDVKPVIRLWLGNQTRIAAHYDIPDNIACVVAGKRRFTLFPPEQLENLYVGPLDLTPAGQAISLVDFQQPDFDRHPKFRAALKQARLAELEPGDALFIPSMWWHHVEGLDSFNMLVNYWWQSVPAYLGSPLDALYHALLSIRDLPAAQRDAWRGLFEHYVFGADASNPDDSVAAHIPEQARGPLAPLDEPAARKLRALLLKHLNR